MTKTFLENFLEEHGLTLKKSNMSNELFAYFTKTVQRDFKYNVLAIIDGFPSWGGRHFYACCDDEETKLSPYRLWMDKNCVDEWVLLDFKFYFKNKDDALRFKLIWGCL